MPLLGSPAPPPGAWWLVGDVLWWCRVTQLLERLSRVVEEGNLFEPTRPSLGSELEALRQQLEVLSSGPDSWESRPDRPAGVPWARGRRLELWCLLGLNPSSVTSCLRALFLNHCSSCRASPVAELWCERLSSEPAGDAPPGQSWPSAPSFCLSRVLLSGLGGQGPEGALAFPDTEPVAA